MARPAVSASGQFRGRPGASSMRELSGDREPVRLVSLVNIALSTGGLIACDSVTPDAGDRILLPNQIDPTENGIYTAAAGPWYRASDARSSRTMTKGVQVRVQDGNTKGLSIWQFRSMNPVIGEDVISIVEPPSAAGQFGFGVLDMVSIGGTANDIAATFNPTYAARRVGQLLRIRPVAPNSMAMTLNPDGFGAIPMKMPDGSAIPAGKIIAGVDYTFRDDGTNLNLLGSNVIF